MLSMTIKICCDDFNSNGDNADDGNVDDGNTEGDNIDGDMGSSKKKTKVLLCKRLSEQFREVYMDMVVYFNLHWWRWAVVD